ncbi:hypothetical protein EDC04DRAFT_1356033 [Pisolithus marmoratus]|nr:hypothetical protein EDC04DRAFT_1356033 [Pisolithus marmoratus]
MSYSACIQAQFMRGLLRPFAAHFIRGPWTVILPLRHIRLMECRMILLGLITLADCSQKHSSTCAFPSLLTFTKYYGTKRDFIFLHFAYSELRNLATDSSPSSSICRVALFSDQKYNPSLWSTPIRAASSSSWVRLPKSLTPRNASTS